MRVIKKVLKKRKQSISQNDINREVSSSHSQNYSRKKPRLHRTKKSLRYAAKHTKAVSKKAHHHVAVRPHNRLMSSSERYNRWHSWRFHKHTHALVLIMYIAVVGLLVGSRIGTVFASDLLQTWNFADAGEYSFDEGTIETEETSARLKAQNYNNDEDTAALYHLDEINGSSAEDSSSNNNDAEVNDASFATGNLNNGLSFNGIDQNAVADDSASLSLGQQHTIEGWIKLNEPLSAGSTYQRQSIVDKGDYQLYLDNETGKLTYEIADSSSTSWTQQAGNDLNGSWDLDGNRNIESMARLNDEIYASTGDGTGDAEVWRWNGTRWTQIGGDGLNNCWPTNTYERVLSMTADGGNLYVGLGVTAGDAEVWRWNGTTWSKIGGDAINSSWPVNTFEGVYSLTHVGGKLYAGLGASANDAEVWEWNGSAWSKIGGDSLNSGWTTNFELVSTLNHDGTNVYAGLGLTAGDAEVWRWNGTTWAQIGGDGVNSSWANSTYEYILSATYNDGSLYVGLGTTANDAEVWRWNGTAWTQIGGDSLNSGWTTNYEGVYSLTSDGTNIYAGLGLTAGDNEVWRWDGDDWEKIGGDTVNSGFTNTHVSVNSLLYYGSTLFAGLNSTSGSYSAQVWTFTDNNWTLIGGDFVNFSWGFRGLQSVEVMQQIGDKLYAGTGVTVVGNATVWEFDGDNWTLIGGQGVNGSWAANTYESVTSMGTLDGDVYVGLGVTANDAEVWRWDGESWEQVGGDSLNSGWAANFEEVNSLAAYDGLLYAGLGNSNNDAEVWAWDGESWSKIGGDSINSGWTTNYNRVSSMAIYGGELHVGLGNNTGEAEVWRWNGSSWLKIGGDAVSSSWADATFEQVESMIPYNGKLYTGLGNTTNDAQVWEWDGSTWSLVGGENVNSSWDSGTYERLKTLAVYNGNLYAGLGNGTGDGEVWRYNNSSWTKIGGNGLNSGWSNAVEEVESFSAYKGKLYAGTGLTANADAAVWSYGDNGFLQSNSSTFDDSWHHVAATFSGTTMKLYIDGNEVGSKSENATLPDGSKDLLIGSTYGGREYGKPRGHLNGMLDEIRLSDTVRPSFTFKPYSTEKQTIEPEEAIYKFGVDQFDTFDAEEITNGGSITYRLSNDDGETWQYWDGNEWTGSGSLSDSNSKSEINDHIPTFEPTFYGIKWQAILESDGDQRVSLDSVTINATSDSTGPSTNAADIEAQKTNGGASLANNAWTNGASPYFEWTEAEDDDTDILGYCLYLGQDNTADPRTAKGILGDSPVYSSNACQFIAPSNNIDLASPGALATELETSDEYYYLSIKAIDRAGNLAENSAQFAFRFDDTPPSNPGFISAPSGFINTKDVTITWPTAGGQAATDNDSGLAGLQYKINNTGWYGDNHTGSGDINDLLVNDGSYTTSETPDYNNLNEGINNIYIRTWDQAGNTSVGNVSAALKINTDGAPSEPLNLEVTPETNDQNSFSFDWDQPETFVGESGNLTYCYTVNTLPSSSSCIYTQAGSTNLSSGPFATQPGENTFYVVARDESNSINYSSYSSVTFNANTTAPGAPTNADIVDVSIKSTSNWRLALTWEPPEDDGSGISSYKVYRSDDNDDFDFVGSSTSTTYIDANLDQETYYYFIKACDSTNNCGANSTRVNMLPTGKFTEAANLTSKPKISDVTTKRATVSWATDRNSDSKVLIGTKSGNYSSSEVGNSNQVTDHEINLDNLAAGTTYYAKVKWTDEDGNTGSSQEFSFTTQPAPVIKEIRAVKVGLNSAIIQFTSKGANKINLYFGQTDSFGGLKSINTSADESTYTIEVTGLNDGTKYFYTIGSFDSEGTEYKGNVLTFLTPERPQISNLQFQPVKGAPSSTQSVTWQTNVPASSLVTYGKLGTSGTDIQKSQLTTDHKIIISGLDDNSQYFIVAQSRDRNGNLAVSDRQVFRTAKDTRPPQVSDITVETSIRGTGAEARGQVIVSWKSDEPSTSQVGYAEGSNATVFNNKTTEDTQLTTEHIVVVSDLPPSKVYSVQPISRDDAGNAGYGEIQPVIIGRASESVLTIILNTLQRVFGL